MPKKYDIRLTAVIEIGGVFEANSAEEARAAAEMELRPRGEITDIQVGRCIYNAPCGCRVGQGRLS